MAKLKTVKGALRTWNKFIFGDVNLKVEQAWWRLVKPSRKLLLLAFQRLGFSQRLKLRSIWIFFFKGRSLCLRRNVGLIGLVVLIEILLSFIILLDIGRLINCFHLYRWRGIVKDKALIDLLVVNFYIDLFNQYSIAALLGDSDFVGLIPNWLPFWRMIL